jgi:hypothetical protein
MATVKNAGTTYASEAEKIKYMVVLLKESLEIKRGELAQAKEEILRLHKRIKEIEQSMKRFEKLIKAAQS